MIEQAINVIGKDKLEEYALRLHQPQEAVYVIVDNKMQHKVISKERFTFNSKYCTMDFYSRVINANKAVDPKKAILSNNYYTFFVKDRSKLKDTIIAEYYKRCGLPGDKLYIQEWIQENINFFDVPKNTWLKILFVEEPIECIELGRKYLLERNLTVPYQYKKDFQEGEGVPLGINMNAKKPFLAHKTRNVKVPMLSTQEEGYERFLFFDILKAGVKKGKELLYIDSDTRNLYFASCRDRELPFSQIRNGMLFVSRETTKGELEIVRMEPVVNYSKYL